MTENGRRDYSERAFQGAIIKRQASDSRRIVKGTRKKRELAAGGAMGYALLHSASLFRTL